MRTSSDSANRVLTQRERGVLARVNSKWRQHRTQCNNAQGSSDPVGLLPVLPALGALMAGLAGAWAVALAERRPTYGRQR